MDDNKLTEQEYKIRNTLEINNIPIKLVQVQHGLWAIESKNLFNGAIIAFKLK